MDQLSQLHDDTSGDSFFDLEQVQQGLSQHELNRFIQKLLTTIDLPVLTELFYQQLQNTLQLSALKIQFNDRAIQYSDVNKTKNIKNLNYIHNGQTIATVSYGFNRTLAIHDWQVLQQLHLFFRHPLKNALEHHSIKQFAMKDHLTSLGNRANYDETMQRMLSGAKRNNIGFGLLVIDMDEFKQVNDQFGHNEGDKVLLAFADTVQHCLRDTDFAFRFGGDEFCCILGDSAGPSNQMIAERIRQAVRKNNLLAQHGVSCSIGSTNYQKDDGANTLFARADQALYQAKNEGRDCIRAA